MNEKFHEELHEEYENLSLEETVRRAKKENPEKFGHLPDPTRAPITRYWTKEDFEKSDKAFYKALKNLSGDNEDNKDK